MRRFAMKNSPFHKYGAKRVNLGDRSFASQFERAIYLILLAMEQANEIREIKCQPHVYLTRAKIHMIPDFSCIDAETGELFYVEAKGFETERWLIMKKLWTFYGPGKLNIWKGTASKPRLVETITPTG